MKIIKYRKYTKSRYKIYLDDGKEFILYEDVILKYNLLLKKEITDKLLKEVIDINREYEIYYVALESINHKFKSVYDTKQFLLKKEYPIELIDKNIEKLLKQGYLNDRSFAKSYINNQICCTKKGPNKIKRELLEHKVSNEIIEEEILIFDVENQLEKIDKLANRMYNANRNRGGTILKKKIVNDLINYGYDINLINKVIDNFDFKNNKDIAAKEYDKLYKKLSRKYEGKELEYKIKEKLYMKGLYYED